MSIKVKLSLAERTINRLFYGDPPSRKLGGMARDQWAFDILNEAFEEARQAEIEACAQVAELEWAGSKRLGLERHCAWRIAEAIRARSK